MGPVTSETGCCFSLWLHVFIVISPLFSSSILGTYQPVEFIFQYYIFLPFHTVHRVLKTRILKWVAIPFSSGPRFVRTLHHDPLVLGGLQGMAHSFTELDKAGLPDGRVQGCVLISCEDSKITTHRWTTIERGMLDLSKNRYPTSKGKGEAPARW